MKTKKITIYLEPHLFERLQELARTEERKLSQMIRIIILRYLQSNENSK